MLPIKFRFNPTYGLGDVVWRISGWPPYWISERNNFSNSDASHKVLVQSDLWFGRRFRLINFKMATILDIGTEILVILNLHNAPMPPSSFGSIWLLVWEMSFEEFQDGSYGGHLGYQNGTILAILNLYVTPMTPIKFQINLTSGLGRDAIRRISRWPPCHLGYQNWTILAILNLWVTVMPSIKFWLNPNYGLEGDIVWRISSWLPWWPSWISEQNDFSNSESLCHCDASYQVSAQSDFWFGRRCHLKNFKRAAMSTILDIGKEWF